MTAARLLTDVSLDIDDLLLEANYYLLLCI
jgi:hypothetical protein